MARRMGRIGKSHKDMEQRGLGRYERMRSKGSGMVHGTEDFAATNVEINSHENTSTCLV